MNNKFIVFMILAGYLTCNLNLFAANRNILKNFEEANHKKSKITNKIKRLKKSLAFNEAASAAIGVACGLDLIMMLGGVLKIKYYLGFEIPTFLIAAWCLARNTRSNLIADIQDLEEELASLKTAPCIAIE